MSTDRTLDKVAALLAQAEGTDNENEAEVFMEKAQAMATAASIDLAVARAHTNGKRRAAPTTKQIAIGEPRTKGLYTYALLFSQIARANDLQCDVAHNNTFVILFGFEDDMRTAETLYLSLVRQMVAASTRYLADGAWREAERYDGRRPSKITCRLDFQSAFAWRIGARMKEAADRAREQAEKNAPASSSTALALRDRDVEVRSFYESNTKARGSWRAANRGVSVEAAYNAGDRAGKRAKITEDERLAGARGAIES